MSPSPRKTIDPEFIAALDCPICGQDQLSIKSLANYPDFVTCANCDSQFAVEQGGERIMYGKIPATYPRTRRFALQEWVWPEAIARRAQEERPESGAGMPAATELPPPVSPSQPSEPATETSEPPVPTELAPEQAAEEQTPIAPEGSVQQQTLREELTQAAEPGFEPSAAPGQPDEAQLEPPEVPDEALPEPPDEPEDALPEPPMDQAEDLLEPPEEQAEEDSWDQDWPGQDAAATVLAEMDDEDEDFLGDWADEIESPEDSSDDFEDEWDAPEPTRLASEWDTPDEITELPTDDDFFDDSDEGEPTTFPDFDQLEGEGEAEPAAAQESEESDSSLIDDWDRFDAETIGRMADDEDLEEDFFEDELEAFEEGFASAEPDFEGLTEQTPSEDFAATSEASDIFTPPFGDDEPESGDNFPEEFEPAPPMPDWLNTEQDESDDMESDDMEAPVEQEFEAGMDAIDFASLRDDVSDEAAESSFGEEQDLLASLWGEADGEEGEDEAEEFEAEQSTAAIDDELAGFAGLGAIGEFAEETELPAEEESQEAADLWPEESDSEQTIIDPFIEGEAEALSEAEPTLDPARQEIARQQWAGDQPSGPSEEELALAPEGDEPLDFEAEEPPPGERYRVVLANHQAKFPDDLCAHCNQSPTVAHIPVTASVYRGAGVGDRQVVTYRLPVCAECRDRAKARSDERQTAQLQAHLVSVLIAMILVVSALAFRIVDFQGQIGFDLGILLLCGGMGYAVPVVFLLIRASRIGKPSDAQYVETTLQVPGDTEGAETAFEFRNKRYAHYFFKKNKEEAVSKVNKVRERHYEPEAS